MSLESFCALSIDCVEVIVLEKSALSGIISDVDAQMPHLLISLVETKAFQLSLAALACSVP